MFLLNFSKPCAVVYIVPIFPFSFSSKFLPVPGSFHFLPSQRCCLLDGKAASTTSQNSCDQGAACCEMPGKSLRLLPASHSSHPQNASNSHYLLQVPQRLSRFTGDGLWLQGQNYFCILHWHFGWLRGFVVLLLSSMCFNAILMQNVPNLLLFNGWGACNSSSCCHPLASKSNLAGSSSWERRDNNLECVSNSCLFQCFPEGMEHMASWTYICSTDPTNSRGFYY